MGENGYIRKNLVVIMTSFYLLGVTGTRPLVSLLSHNLGANLVEIGIITAIFALLPFFLAIQIGKYIDHHGYKLPILYSSLFSFIGLILPMVIPNLFGIYVVTNYNGSCLYNRVVADAGASVNKENNRDSNVMKFSLGMALGSFLGPYYWRIFR
ncbi:hypothetical protein UACE39S_05431 [Ureibacillus acetophenoni]